ncbi:MAG TPA: NADP-binding protein [Candidatus Nanoarchaeia archaeon]|nr:NADP-binding protein [Candidatus Nanoarchaeia archaeon]
MKKRLRVLQFGLGAMGSKMVEMILKKEDLELVGAVVKPEKDGRDIGELLGWKKKIGIKGHTAPDAFRNLDADIMLHAAVSHVPDVWKQIRGAVHARINIITIAEEMGFPFVKYPKLCEEMDDAAKLHGISILGSGINPGFAMDLLPLTLTGILHSVKKIKVTRLVDFSPFGPAIQKNIGIGFTPVEFRNGIKEGSMPGHIGLSESAHMIAHALGWKLDKLKETKVPVIAKKSIHVHNYKTVKPGQVAGFDQRLFAFEKGKLRIVLEELGRVDPEIEYKNIIQIDGYPSLVEWMSVPTGKLTTTAHAVNLLPVVYNASPGLLTMLDLPVAHALKDRK